MRDKGWIKLLLWLLLAATTVASASDAAQGDSEDLSGELEDPRKTPGDAILSIAPAESQQVSFVAPYNLYASASGYGKGYGKGSSHKGHKGYKLGYHDKEGYKGKKGHKDHKGYKKSHYGDYGSDHKKGYHDKGGKYYKGHDDKHKYYGDEHKGKKGKKGHHYGSKGHHNKGHKDKGYKNVYHKEEYHHQKKYYDDFDNKKYHNKYDDFDSYFDAHKGKDHKGGHYKRELTEKQNRSHSHMESHIEGSLIISNVKAVLEKLNIVSTTSKNDVDTETTTRYLGRVLLDASSQRTRYSEHSVYDSQCHEQDLRMIRKYLGNCNRFLSKYGWQEDKPPPCNYEDILKLKRYLELCQRSFLKGASRRDENQYEKLMALASKLEMMSYPDTNDEDAAYVTEDVCKVRDLKQMELYLTVCSSRKDNSEESGLPACDLPNYEKSLDYLSACESTFLSKASRKDQKKYNRLVSAALTLIKRETYQTEEIKRQDSEQSQTACTVDDLRESQNYIEECESLLQTVSYQREYGSQMCKRKYMLKVHNFLSNCEHLIRNAASKDQRKFRELLDTSARLSKKPGKPRKGIGYTKTDMTEERPDCDIQDLRSIPKYLRACYRSKSCEGEQLLEIHEFLVMCEEKLLKEASPRDKKKYKDLVLMSDMLNTNQLLRREKSDRDDQEHMESICKIQILRKVPKYLKGCFESGNCKSKQLLKVIKFLSLCEEFFSIAFSPKDRGKYKELKEISKELLQNTQDRSNKPTNNPGDNGDIDCSLRDLRRVPKYLKRCEKSKFCREEQLFKIYQFLFYCEIPFSSSASRRDKAKYKHIMVLSEKLSKISKGKVKESENNLRGKHECKVSDLRRIPKYLSNCVKFNNCKRSQLQKVKNFLKFCKTSFFKKASKKAKTKYKSLISHAESVSKHSMKSTITRKSSCHIKDLRKIPSYLTKCTKTKKCSQRKLVKVSNFLFQCRRDFFKKATRREKNKYEKLFITSKQLSKKKTTTPKMHQSSCQIRDLRKIPDYLRKCSKSQNCNRRQLTKVSIFMNTCKKFFMNMASRRDVRKYEEISKLADKLVKSQPQQTPRSGQYSRKRSHQSYCHLRDLRKIPTYLKTCARTQNCKQRQIAKVTRFLITCKSHFAKRASRKDGRLYGTLTKISRRLSEKRIISKKPVRRRRKKLSKKKTSKAKMHQSSCQIRDLRKIPDYLRKCSKSQNCNRRQLTKVSIFMNTCKKSFMNMASRRDVRKYEEISKLADKLVKSQPQQTPRSGQYSRKRSHQSYCHLRDLRKIPTYLKTCARTQNCKQRQIAKVTRFLITCKSHFAKRASRKDGRLYGTLTKISRRLSEKRIISKKPVRRRRKKLSKKKTSKAKMHQSSCQIRDLRKIPDYLRKCSKSQNCNRRQLTKVSIFMNTCKRSFMNMASRRDVRKYEEISKLADKLVKSQPQQTPRSGQYSRKRSHQSYCHLRDLRKIPTYLKTCARTQNCKQRQIAKVTRFLITCKSHFAKRASRKDGRLYGTLTKISRRLSEKRIINKKPVRRRRKSKSQETCQLKVLRSIRSHLQICEKMPKQKRHVRDRCKTRSIARMESYLLKCQRTFLQKASRADQATYRGVLAISRKLKRGADKTQDKSFSKRDSNRSICQRRNLRKVPEYLNDCSKGFIITDKRKVSCSSRHISKIMHFLSTCESQFYKIGSSGDKKKYSGLLKVAERLHKRDTAKGRKRTKTPMVSKQGNCRSHILRRARNYLTDCSGAHNKGRRHALRRLTAQGVSCTKQNTVKVQRYLKSCQSIFLGHASRRDKENYKSLLLLATQMSRARLQTRDTKYVSKKVVYKCGKKELTELEKHYKYCSTKLRRDAMRKSKNKRLKRKSLEQRRRDHLKRKRTERQYRKYKSPPGRRSKKTVRKEHGRQDRRRRRAEYRNRQGGKHHNKHGKKGHHEKGKYHDDHKGHKGHYDHKGHYGHKSSYGKKGGNKEDYDHEDHKGYGHDDHHKGGYGHEDHHGGGYGHDDHHGGGYGHDGHHGGGYGHDDHHGDGYGHDDHGGYGSHSNVKPVSAPIKFAAPAPVYTVPGPAYPTGPAPVYVPAPAASNIKASSSEGFYPSLKLLFPPVAASSGIRTIASEANPARAFSRLQPVEGHYTFETFGDFGKFS